MALAERWFLLWRGVGTAEGTAGRYTQAPTPWCVTFPSTLALFKDLNKIPGPGSSIKTQGDALKDHPSPKKGLYCVLARRESSNLIVGNAK